MTTKSDSPRLDHVNQPNARNQSDPRSQSLDHTSLVLALYARWSADHQSPSIEYQPTIVRWINETSLNQVSLDKAYIDETSIDQTWTINQLKIEIEKTAGYLHALQLKRGDIIGVQLPRSIDWLPLFLGALSQGIAILLLNDAYTPRELSECLNDSGARYAILPSKHHSALKLNCKVRLIDAEMLHTNRIKHPRLKPHSDITGDNLAVLAYTSGTTGRPKGARIRHRDIIGTLQALHRAWEWSPRDRLLHTLPLFHIHGLFVAALGALWASAELMILPNFEALKALRAVERYQATILMGVPTHHHRYLKVSADIRPKIDSLRLVTSGSAPLSAEHFDTFKKSFGIEIVERYGMTEVGIVLSAPLHGEKKAGSVGFPLPGVHAKVCDADHRILPPNQEGELHISSLSLFEGYHQRIEATHAALYHDDNGQRWMKTGDIAYQDQDGRYWLKGRASELIISGGLNVYPKEVERVLYEQGEAWLDEVAVVGITDLEWGERVVAFITTVDMYPPTPQQILNLKNKVRTKLARFKCPKEIHWIKSLPRNAMGKLQRFKLKKSK